MISEYINKADGIHINGQVFLCRYAPEERRKKPVLYVWRDQNPDNPFDPFGWVRVASFVSDEMADIFVSCLKEAAGI